MAVIAIHKRMDGTPVGVWANPTESLYVHNATQDQNRAKALMEDMGTQVTWADWVDTLANRISHQDWWDMVDSNDDLRTILTEQRSEYSSQ